MKRWLVIAIICALGLSVSPGIAFKLAITPQQLTATAGGVANGGTDSAMVTTASLTTAAGATYTLTFNAQEISPSSLVQVSVGNGSNTAGTPTVASVTAADTSASIVVQNIHSANAFNGTLKIAIVVFN
jgi:hypothetical protein